MGTKEASERWGVKPATVTDWCRKGLIKDAEQDAKGSPWRIPIDTPNPRTERMRLNHTKKEC